MHILIDKDAGSFDDQITYLYQVHDGPSPSSFGTNCAAIGGFPDKVIARAEQLLQITANGESQIDALHVLSDAEKKNLKHAEKVAKKFAQWDIDQEPDESLRLKLREIVQ